MNFSKLSFIILALLIFASCGKNSLSIDKETSLLNFMTSDDEGKDDKDKDYDKDKDKEACFELVFPISITMPDGSELSGDEETVWDAVKSWYEANPEAEEKPEFNYPIDLLFKDETVKTMENEEDLIAVKEYCDGKDKEACFELAYPLTYVFPDGSTITGEEGEVEDALKSWYEANSEVETKPELAFPVDIIWKDGSTQTVEDELAMELAKKDC